VSSSAALNGPAAADRALVVDLDGTLLKSDLLVESFFSLLANRPLRALASLAALRRSKAAFKARLAEQVTLQVANLPWRGDLLAYLQAERARGRRIYLASASDRRLVEAVAAEHGLFDGIFASDGSVNLKGAAKATALVQAFGAGGFDYVGNEAADFAVWEQADRILVAGAAPALQQAVQARWPEARIFEVRPARLGDYVRQLRVHQWLKNLLLLVPAIAAHRFDLATLVLCLIGLLSFSLCASGVYVLNDMVDLERDRRHPSKRNRPFAAGTIPIFHGLLMVPALVLASLLLALLLPPLFIAMLAVYLVLTMGYSLWLKRQMMLDVVALACLYGIRLLAGGAASGVELSAWLAALSIFLFCSLALTKRCTELTDRIARDAGNPVGRDYVLTDLPILQILAGVSGFTAILVLALYVNSDTVRALYRWPVGLWALCVIMVYWVGRVQILAHRGKMPDDPVVFAATDRVSLICAGLAVIVLLASL
jgi:4-hydroxybenzoate polyprenyltransferase